MRASAVIKATAPLRLAVVGAGPSGFYAAARLLNAFPKQSDEVRVDLFERLPTPYGLVRYGVAPDHPDVKNVQHKFDEVCQDPRLNFYGNVNVVNSASEDSPYPQAYQLPLEELRRCYTHVLFAYGSSQGRPLGIPGSRGEVGGVHSALEFVNWYNGHPAAHDPRILAAQRGSRGLGIDLVSGDKRHLTVVGAGNVALDVARIVLRSSTSFLEPSGQRPSHMAPGLAALASTDLPEPVLAHLAASKISRVDIFARRGPAQLAFTNKELREMLALEGVAFSQPEPTLLEQALADITATEAKTPEATSDVRVRKRMISLLQKGSKAGQGKSWGINFFRSPIEFTAGQSGSVEGAKWSVTELGGKAKPANAQAAWGNEPGKPPGLATTGETVSTQTDMVVSSVGYRSEPLWGAATTASLPFDAAKAIVPSEHGRVLDEQGNIMPFTYVSGWLARGPVGVIASTMMDAYSVADQILGDHRAHPPPPPTDAIEAVLKHSTVRIVSKHDWAILDAEEQRRGKALNKMREKILSVDEMLSVLG